MTCTICKSNRKTKYLPIYVFGSEGVNVCDLCEAELRAVIYKMTMEQQSKRFKIYRNPPK